MPANSVLELLAAQSAAKLQAMEHAIDEQIADLRSQRELVGRALTEKGVRPKTTPNSNGDAKPSKRRKQRNSRTGSSSVIRQIFLEQPERVWMPIEVINKAHERGVSSTAQAIRVQLRRMGEQGFLERGPGGTGWRLAAASNGSAGEPYAEANKTSSPKADGPEGDEDVG
jgi:hypothetical protein